MRWLWQSRSWPPSRSIASLSPAVGGTRWSISTTTAIIIMETMSTIARDTSTDRDRHSERTLRYDGSHMSETHHDERSGRRRFAMNDAPDGLALPAGGYTLEAGPATFGAGHLHQTPNPPHLAGGHSSHAPAGGLLCGHPGMCLGHPGYVAVLVSVLVGAVIGLLLNSTRWSGLAASGLPGRSFPPLILHPGRGTTISLGRVFRL